MKRNHWPVEDYGIRPAGKPDECFYCSAKKGDDHRMGCVIRSRTVVVRYTIDVVQTEPEDHDSALIEFGINESSWCANNLVEQLERMRDRVPCLCGFVHGEFLREATPEEEAEHNLRIAECES